VSKLDSVQSAPRAGAAYPLVYHGRDARQSERPPKTELTGG